MIVAPERKVVYIDVDSTLVFSESECPNLTDIMVERWVTIGGRDWLVHHPHVETIKDFHARGHTVIVWSQGGPLWAESVVRALGLERAVYACLPKPDWIFDDKPIEQWIEPSRRYYKSP